MAAKNLFSVPIPVLGQHPGGTIVASEVAPAVYLLTFTSPPDNRLTTAFCRAMLDALDIIEVQYPTGVVITTSGIPKFYSNGLDLEHATSTPGYWVDSLYTLWKRFLTYPMPTIALLNGHGFAGGLMLALHHDYRVMNPSKGFVCANELDFGAPLKAPMSSIFRIKLPASTYRSIVLEAKRFPGPEALEASIVDRLGGLDEVLTLVKERQLTKKGATGVYGLLKAEMYRESLALLTQEGFEKEEEKDQDLVASENQRKAKAESSVADLVKQGKAKL